MTYGLQNQSFTTRLSVASQDSEFLMMVLKDHYKHFESYEKASTEDDKEGIDFWVTYPGSSERTPIQFKVRENPKFKDCPVSRYQPLYGIDHEKNGIGRDYRNLCEKKSKQYYVGIRSSRRGGFQSVYRISSEKVLENILQLEAAWERATVDDRMLHQRGVYNKGYFNKVNVSSWLACGVRDKMVFENSFGQVWWKMNGVSSGERRPKFNMYIPEDLKEENFLIEGV